MRTTTGCYERAHARAPLLGQCRRGGARTAAGETSPRRRRAARRGRDNAVAGVVARVVAHGDRRGRGVLSGHKDPSRHAIEGVRSALQVRARRDKVEKKESAKLAAQEPSRPPSRALPPEP